MSYLGDGITGSAGRKLGVSDTKVNDMDLEHEKRKIIDSLELLRSGPEANTVAGPIPPEANVPGAPEIIVKSDLEYARMKKELNLAQETVILLEDELHQIEQKALDAIAEAGRLRRELDLLKTERNHSIKSVLPDANDDCLHHKLYKAENDRSLLSEALCASESEIARLTRTLEIASRKLLAS